MYGIMYVVHTQPHETLSLSLSLSFSLSLFLYCSIVNQMLWSMQLEIPDSPGVLKRRPPNPTRERSLTAVKRSSYASQLVEESLERVEQDERAMAAARSKRIGSESSMTASISAAGPQGVDNRMGSSEESGRGESVSEDYLDVSGLVSSLLYMYVHTCSHTVKYIPYSRKIWRGI